MRHWSGSNVGCVSRCGIFGNSPTRIVDDFLHNSPDISITFSIVQFSKLGGCLIVVGVCFELIEKVGELSMFLWSDLDIRLRESASVP